MLMIQMLTRKRCRAEASLAVSAVTPPVPPVEHALPSSCEKDQQRLWQYRSRAPLPRRGVGIILMQLLVCSTLLPRGAATHKYCNGVALVDCQRRYERCKLFSGPSQDKQLTLCKCAKLYYGSCLRDAGCASDYMMECIDELLANDCPDMTVCGNNCASAHNVPKDAIILPVNNYGENYLRFGYCNTTALDLDYLAKYSTVRITKCVAGAFTFCPYWVPPRTFTSLAIPANAVFLDMWYCQFEQVGGNVTHSSCLSHYDEFYGQPQLWPSSLDIDFAKAFRCESDADCPGSFCDRHFQPPICSPKVLPQLVGAAADFYQPPFKTQA